MANSLAFAVAYQKLIDTVYTQASATKILEFNPMRVQLGDPTSNEVKIQKIVNQGLGSYNRLNGVGGGGYTPRSATMSWDTYKVEIERSAALTIDRADMDEARTSILTFAQDLMITQVIPEIDAYRFGKMATLAGTDTTATLTYDTVIAAIDAACLTLNEANVPQEQRVLFVSHAVKFLMEQSGEWTSFRNVVDNGIINRGIQMYNNMPVIAVNQNRFQTKINLLDGTSIGEEAGGYEIDALSKDINFMIAHSPAVVPVVKLMEPKIVGNEVNMMGRGTFFAFQLYHDLIIPQNKLPGVYCHTKA